MAQLIQVPGSSDPRLGDYRDLRDVQLRRSLEAEYGLFIAEGEKVVRRALHAGFRPRSFLMAPRWLAALADELSGSSAPCYVLTEELVEEVTGFHVHRGALAAFERRSLPQVETVINRAQTLFVLEDIVDHTNVGAIFRSAAALGIDGLLLSPRCADPLYRRAIKVAMGAVFEMPWTRIEDWSGAVANLQASGFSTVALSLSEDSVALDEALVGLNRVALLLGSEGHGLSSRWNGDADVRAQIPMSRGIDSLNVAAASAVAAYALGRRHH